MHHSRTRCGASSQSLLNNSSELTYADVNKQDFIQIKYLRSRKSLEKTEDVIEAQAEVLEKTDFSIVFN